MLTKVYRFLSMVIISSIRIRQYFHAVTDIALFPKKGNHKIYLFAHYNVLT